MAVLEEDGVAERGWYIDPADPHRHRWWDGHGWTVDTRPAVSAGVANAPTLMPGQSGPLSAGPWLTSDIGGPGGGGPRRWPWAVGVLAVIAVVGLVVALVVPGGGTSPRHVQAGATTVVPTTRAPASTLAPPTTLAGPLPAAVNPPAIANTGNGPAPAAPRALTNLAPWHAAVEAQDAGFFATEMGVNPNYLAATAGRWYQIELEANEGAAEDGIPASTDYTTTVDAVLDGNADVALRAAENGYARLGYTQLSAQNTGNPLTREVSAQLPNQAAGTAYSSVLIDITDLQNGTSMAELTIDEDRNGKVPPTAPAFDVPKAVVLGGGSYTFFMGTETYTDGAYAAALGLASPRDTQSDIEWQQEAPLSVNETTVAKGMSKVLCAIPNVSCDPTNEQEAPDVEYDEQVLGQSDAAQITVLRDPGLDPPSTTADAEIVQPFDVRS